MEATPSALNTITAGIDMLIHSALVLVKQEALSTNTGDDSYIISSAHANLMIAQLLLSTWFDSAPDAAVTAFNHKVEILLQRTDPEQSALLQLVINRILERATPKPARSPHYDYCADRCKDALIDRSECLNNCINKEDARDQKSWKR